MANYSITAIIGAVTDKFNKGLDTAKNKAKSFASGTTKAVKGVQGGIAGATSKLSGFGHQWQMAMGHPAIQAATAAGQAMVSFGTDAVKTAGNIEAKMNEVFTLMPGITQGAKEKMSKELLSLSAQMGKMPEDFINSLYNSLSAGVPPENVFNFLETASKSAIAGVATTEEAVGALTTVINGYKMPVTEAANVSDTLFTVIKNGVTTMPELAANIGKVTPIAASLGISFDEVGAAFAEMTKNLGPNKSAETGTMLKAFFAEISKGGSKSAEAFERISGKSFPEFIKGGGSVADALKMMAEEADKNNERITDMFGSIEAGQAALILSANGAKGLGEQMEEMGKTAGGSTKAFETVDSGFSRMMEKLMAGFEVFKVTVGKALAPLVDALMPQLLKGLKMISALPWNKVGEYLGIMMEAYAPIQDVLFELIEELFPLLMNLLKALLPQMMAGIPLLVLVLKALVLIMKPLNFIFEILGKFGEIIGKIIGWVSRLIGAATGGSKEFKEELGEVLKDVNKFKEALLKWLGPVKKVYEWLMKFFGEAKAGVASSLDAVAYAAKMLWTLVKWPFEMIRDAVSFLFDFVRGLSESFIKRWIARVDVILGLVESLFNWIKDQVLGLAKFLLEIRQSVMDKIFETFPWLEGLIESVTNFFKEKVMSVWNFVSEVFASIKDFILDSILTIWDSISVYVSAIWDLIKEKVDQIREKFMTSNNEVIEALRFFMLVGSEVFGTLFGLAKKAIGIFEKVGSAVGWIGEKLGLTKSKQKELNTEVEKTAGFQEANKQKTEETTAAAKKQLTQAVKIAEQEKEVVATKQAQSAAQKEYVKHGAEMVKTSKVHVGQLNSAVKKHEEINNLGEAYQFIAEGKKTPKQIINEGLGSQVALNEEGKKFTIKDKKGQTPAEQIKNAIPQQGKLNEEAGNNPLLKLKKGELKVTCEQKENEDSKVIIQQLGLIHRDISSLHKTVSGKFCNQ